MGRPRLSEQQKLAKALEELRQIIGSDHGVVRGNQLKNSTRALLLEKRFLREVLKGWYFVSDPSSDQGDTTLFYANFWEYLAHYLKDRFDNKYCLTAEYSLLRHSRYNLVPRQVNVILATNQSQIQELAYQHSLVMYPGGNNFPKEEYVVNVEGLRCMSAPYCLVVLTPNIFRTHPEEVQLVLGTLNDPSAIAALVDVNVSGIGRVIAASRAIGRNDFANSIVSQLSGINIKVTENNPFETPPIYMLGSPDKTPLYARIKMLWGKHRQTVLTKRPRATASDISDAVYLDQVEATKINDAYHSLSIERYRVTHELIEKVAKGLWSTETNPEDKQQIDAMAARGYLEAFELVKESAGAAFTERRNQQAAAKLFADSHQKWFQKLFMPSVDAGILNSRDLVGYRRQLVFLRGSLHSPPHYDSVRDGMTALQECFAAEDDAFVRAVLGHWLFAFIHPYMDGNGRMARFTMNLMLASGGYPWTVIRVEDRDRYMAALESASVDQDLEPFATFVADCVQSCPWDFSTLAED